MNDRFDGRWLGGPTLPVALLPALMSAPLAMAVVDEDGFIIGWNEFATILLGWSPSDVIGTQIDANILPSHLLPAYREIREGRPADDPRIATRRFTMPLLTRLGAEVQAEVALASSVDLGRTVYVVYAWEKGNAAREETGAANPAEGSDSSGTWSRTAAPVKDFRWHRTIGELSSMIMPVARQGREPGLRLVVG